MPKIDISNTIDLGPILFVMASLLNGAHFIGIRGDIYGYKYRAMASYVDNYGIYRDTPPNYVYSHNTAFLLEVSRRFERAWGLKFSLAIAGDIGTQYGNSFGGYLRIAKTGFITAY